MLNRILETIKEPLAGGAISGSFLMISFQNILQGLQIVSATFAIIVAILTAYLTILKIRNEKKRND